MTDQRPRSVYNKRAFLYSTFPTVQPPERLITGLELTSSTIPVCVRFESRQGCAQAISSDREIRQNE